MYRHRGSLAMNTETWHGQYSTYRESIAESMYTGDKMALYKRNVLMSIRTRSTHKEEPVAPGK